MQYASADADVTRAFACAISGRSDPAAAGLEERRIVPAGFAGLAGGFRGAARAEKTVEPVGLSFIACVYSASASSRLSGLEQHVGEHFTGRNIDLALPDAVL